MTDQVTYKMIVDRCNEAAKELFTVEFPKTSTIDSWETYIEDCEKLKEDVYSLVCEGVESWDWSVYTNYGFKILEASPTHLVQQAKSDFHEMEYPTTMGEDFGPYEFASRVSYLILISLVGKKLDELIDEMVELANDAIYNLESN